jgi:potassium efflux system protein
VKTGSVFFFLFPFLLLGATFAMGPVATAQEAAPPTAVGPSLDPAAIDGRLKAAQEKAELDDATKAKVAELYTQAQDILRVADEHRAQGNQYSEVIANVDATIKSLQAALIDPLDSPSQRIPADATSPEIEQQVADADAALNAAQNERSTLEADSAQRSERRRQIPELQTAARQRLAEAQAELDAALAATDPPELLDARQTLAAARKEAAQQELNAYELEIQSYDARGRILGLRLDGATRRAEHLKRESALLRDALTARRQDEALAAANRAREALLEATNAPTAIRELAGRLAEKNTELTLERTGPEGLLRKVEKAGARLAEVRELLTTLTSDFTAVRAKVDAAGIGAGTGALLRTYQRKLEDTRQLARNIRARQQEIAITQVDEIQCEEDRRKLADVESLIDKNLSGLPEEYTEAQRAEFARVLRVLYTTQRDVLDEKIEDYEYYFATLIDLDAQEQQLIAQTREFQRYITERVLWLRSGDLISLDELGPARDAWLWLVNAENLYNFADSLRSDFATSPLPVVSFTFAVLILNALRWHFRRRIAVAAEAAAKRGCMDFRPTAIATVFTLLVSLGIPLLLALIGWRCSVSLTSTDYSRGLGEALGACAFYLWGLEFAREVLRANGLGIAHFGWSESSCRAAARRFLGFELVVFPLAVIIATLDIIQDENNWQETAGRFALMLALLALTVFGHTMLRSRNGAMLEIIERARKRSNLKLRRLWYAMAVFTPIALFLAAAYGYSYSALQIATKLHYLLMCAFSLMVVVQLVLRWMLVARRQMARARAKKKLEAMRESGGEGEGAVMEEEVDLDKIDTQAMRLIRSSFAVGMALCVWWIWADDLPALSVLNQVELWTVTDTITTETLDAAGKTVVDTREQQVPITLRHLAAFIFIAAITTVAVRNLPGLLEILVWQRLSLVAGERYAANTIITYALTLLGGTWAFSAVGLSWGKLQWLFAAVGLGLGFGLQEIFANLVSGIILLFERPVRVGDVVTVGDVSGTVSRIRIRATWITAFNRQELIVPNKEFVTGRLINWTLSDRVLRIELNVGIAYGSDIALAKRLMMEAVVKNEAILNDPAPTVFFTGFGESALNFVVRAHCADQDIASITRDAVLTAIDTSFREHGIELPFPQRDVHIHGIGALPDGALKMTDIDEITKEKK